MNWEQKLWALDALAGAGRLIMRQPGDWCSSHSVEIKQRSTLTGGAGNGPTPQEAIEDEWANLTERLGSDQYLVLRAPCDDRRAVRWNGFMWADVPEPRTNSVSREIAMATLAAGNHQ